MIITIIRSEGAMKLQFTVITPKNKIFLLRDFCMNSEVISIFMVVLLDQSDLGLPYFVKKGFLNISADDKSRGLLLWL